MRSPRAFLAFLVCVAVGLGVSARAHEGHDHRNAPPYAQGVLLMDRGLWEEAADAWTEYLHANPLHGGAWFELGMARVKLRDYREAIPAYERALAYGHSVPEAAYNVAACHALLGNADDALRALRRAFELGFDDRALAEADPDFAPLRASAEFREIVHGIDRSSLDRIEGWRADVDAVLERIETRHPEPDRFVTREAFREAAASLKKRVSELSDEAVVVELLRLVAKVGDGHTVLGVPGQRFDGTPAHGRDPVSAFRRLPIRLHAYADGWVVQSATEEHASIVGWKLARVGSHSVDAVFETVAPLCSRDNDQTVLDRAPEYMVCPEILHALGILETRDRATLLLEDASSNRVSYEVEAIALRAQERWTSLGDASTEPVPLRRARPGEAYWFEPLDDRTVYVQLAALRDAGDEPIAAFVERLLAYFDERRVERVVLDLRRNDGGNELWGRPLVDGLACRSAINRPGRLFALIGRRTYSAAVCLCADLERRTNVIFAGEATGSSPNFLGESSTTALPWSGLSLGVSRLRWQTSDPWDRRLWIPAEIPAPLASADERENRDPALEAVLAFRNPTAP